MLQFIEDNMIKAFARKFRDTDVSRFSVSKFSLLLSKHKFEVFKKNNWVKEAFDLQNPKTIFNFNFGFNIYVPSLILLSIGGPYLPPFECGCT